MSINDVKSFNETSQKQSADFVIDGKIILSPVFAIYDKKLKKYMPPYVATSLEDGKRQFENIVSYSATLISRFPEDYCLVHIGDFDDTVGTIILPVKTDVIEAVDCVRSDAQTYHGLIEKADEAYSQVQFLAKNLDDAKAAFEKERNNYILETERLKEKVQKYESKLADLENKAIELFPIDDMNVTCSDANKPFMKKILDKLFSSY